MISDDKESEFARELTTLSDTLIKIAHSTITLAMQLKIASSPAQRKIFEPPALSTSESETSSTPTEMSEKPQGIEKTGVFTREDSTMRLTREVSTSSINGNGTLMKHSESLEILTDFLNGDMLFSTNVEDTTDEFQKFSRIRSEPISMVELYASHGRTRKHSSTNDILKTARGKDFHRTVGRSAQKPQFRFRMQRLLAAASWSNEKDFSIERAMVVEMNKDLKDPVTSMKKRMKQRGCCLVDETKDTLTWRHPKLSVHTWKRSVGTLR